jgi:superfamily II DNA/RNA helicase
VVARPARPNENNELFTVMPSPPATRDTLVDLLRSDDVTSALIFANRKTTVRELNKSLRRSGFATGEIHGDMDQSSRIAELDSFKKGQINILVASDVAARGLDIKGVSHVFNYDTPWHPDVYVHRIGRTGRAGAKGKAFTLVTPEDAEAIGNVEKLTGMDIPVFAFGAAEKTERPEPESKRRRDEGRPRREKPRAEPATPPPPPPRPPAPERSAPEPADEDAGEWNGPVPEFLATSALA